MSETVTVLPAGRLSGVRIKASDQFKRTWRISSWEGRTDPDGRAMVMNMFVHTAHHRAQCEVYLRIKGIKPPDYTF